jgi:hypothetical protein
VAEYLEIVFVSPVPSENPIVPFFWPFLSHTLQLSCPVMGAATGFHCDLASRCQVLTNLFQPLITSQLGLPNFLAMTIFGMDVENRFCYINSGSCNILHGLLLNPLNGGLPLTILVYGRRFRR